MVFTTEEFFKVAIESWREWDLNLRPLNSVQTLYPIKLSGHEFNSHSEPNLCSYSNFIVCSVLSFISAIAFVLFLVYIYIYIYIYKSKKLTLMYVTAVNIRKAHIFSYRYISELYSFVSVCAS